MVHCVISYNILFFRDNNRDCKRKEKIQQMNYIKEYISKSGFTSTYLATKVDCHPSDISHWIAENRKPSQNRLKKLCKALKTSPEISKCNMRDLYPNITFSKLYNKL